MNFFIRSVLTWTLLIWSFAASAQDRILEVTEEGISSSQDSVQVRQDAVQAAVEKVSLRLVRELLGDSKFEKSQAIIKTKVITQSDKYIPFIKTGEGKTAGPGQTKMSVQLKVSLTSLEAVLRQAGLSGGVEGPMVLLPVISYMDLVNNKAMKWWVESPSELNAFLKSQDKNFGQFLKTRFTEKGFQFQDPEALQYRKALPSSLQLDSPRNQDYMAMAQAMKSTLILRGTFRVDPGQSSNTYKVGVRVSILGPNGRVFGDGNRTVETAPGAFSAAVSQTANEIFDELAQDLAGQVQEALSRGTIGSALVRLNLKGAFDYKEVQGFKEGLRANVRSVKAVTERLFTRSGVEFDVDVAGGGQALAQALQTAKWPGLQVKVDLVQSDRVELSRR